MSYFIYKNDKPRTYKGYTIKPNKNTGKWVAYKGGNVSFKRGTLASIKRALKGRRG